MTRSSIAFNEQTKAQAEKLLADSESAPSEAILPLRMVHEQLMRYLTTQVSKPSYDAIVDEITETYQVRHALHALL